MIHGSFDFFFATGCGGNGADGAGCGNGADVAGVATTAGGGGATTSPVVRCCGGSTGGGGGGATGGGGGGGAGREMSDVFGADPAGPVVGPVLRGNAIVCG